MMNKYPDAYLNHLRSIKAKERLYCVACGGKSIFPVITLPKFPLTEFFIKKKLSEKLGFVDQQFDLCDICGHGQLRSVVDPEVLYGSNYITRTSTSASARWAINVFLDFINKVLKNRKIDTLLEIGCNDLYTLHKFKNKAKILYGIDPILKGKEKEFKDGKIRIIGDFFENVDIKGLGLKMDVVLSSHTLEHIEDPKNLIQKLMDAGSKDTTYFFQFPGLETLVSDAHFDQIFHQHLNYFSLKSVLYLLKDTGGELIDYRVNPYHWGALMIAFKKKSKKNLNSVFKKGCQKFTPEYISKQFVMFRKGIDHTAERIDSYKDRTIYGYGAAQMLPVLEYYLKRIENLKYIIDDDPGKKDLYYLNVPVQIKSPIQIDNMEESVILVTAINSLQTIRSVINKLIEKKVERIIIPGSII
jgi:hypothetical protein